MIDTVALGRLLFSKPGFGIGVIAKRNGYELGMNRCYGRVSEMSRSKGHG